MSDAPKTATVLVIDDEELVRNVSRLMLERLGYRALTAGDGVEGIEVLEQHPGEIDAVLLDMTMPRMGGLETFQELQRRQPGIRVILASGYNEEDAAERFRGHGLAGFLQKPFQMPALSEKLRAALS